MANGSNRNIPTLLSSGHPDADIKLKETECPYSDTPHFVTLSMPFMRIWLAERAGQTEEPVFPTRAGKLLSPAALEHRLAKYVEIAATPVCQWARKTMHMRHTAAMRLLRAGIDTSVIALWLGHEQIETTQIYLHADLELKERALAKTAPTNITPFWNTDSSGCVRRYAPRSLRSRRFRHHTCQGVQSAV